MVSFAGRRRGIGETARMEVGGFSGCLRGRHRVWNGKGEGSGGDEVYPSEFYALLAYEVVGHFVDVANGALEDDDLHAVVPVEVYVHGADCLEEVRVLEAGEFLH